MYQISKKNFKKNTNLSNSSKNNKKCWCLHFKKLIR